MCVNSAHHAGILKKKKPTQDINANKSLLRNIDGSWVSQECTLFIPHLEKDIKRHWSGLAHNPTP